MRVVIDISDDDGNSMYGGKPGFPDPCQISDDGTIVLDIGDTRIHMSYCQFDALLNGVLRWRWSTPPEKGYADLAVDHASPDWETMVHVVEQEVAGERRTIVADLLDLAEQVPAPNPQPPRGDLQAQKYFASGRVAGSRDGLIKSAELIRKRAKTYDLTPEPPSEDDGPDKKKARR